MLPNLNRLKKPDFDLLKNFKKEIFSSKNFTLKLYHSGFQPSRFAVVISSAVIKKSVERNKKRRQVKAVILKNLNFLQEGFAVVLYLKEEAEELTFELLERNLIDLFKKADILKC